MPVVEEIDNPYALEWAPPRIDISSGEDSGRTIKQQIAVVQDGIKDEFSRVVWPVVSKLLRANRQEISLRGDFGAVSIAVFKDARTALSVEIKEKSSREHLNPALTIIFDSPPVESDEETPYIARLEAYQGDISSIKAMLGELKEGITPDAFRQIPLYIKVA